MTAETKLWGGRFATATDSRMRILNDSFPYDRHLALVDVRGSIAYAGSLFDVGLLTSSEHAEIVAGLEKVAEEFASATFEPALNDEDIHTAVERRLTELIGAPAGKLHTGRSRNDQVATDLRLYVLEVIDTLSDQLRDLQSAVVTKAEGHPNVVMPGYTHTQPAQPILFSHWLMSFFWKFERDHGRLQDARKRTAISPLGSGALSGTPFPIDREALTKALEFDDASENSLDAVEDRDFVVEFLAAASLLQVHLSVLAETLILWASVAYSFVRLDEAHCTGSSLMPQKRNPDALELIRGKTGRVFGHLIGILTTLKGLPSGYNKDLQEDKEGLFNVIDTLSIELPIVADLVCKLKVNAAHMAAARDSAMLATDLADYLVKKGIPFREAHHLVGSIVRAAETAGCPIDVLPIETYQRVHSAFDADVYSVFDPHQAVGRRTTKGGTAPEAVDRQIRNAKSLLGSQVSEYCLQEDG